MVIDAIEKAEEVLKDVNEAARKHENKQKLQELSRLVDLEGLEVSQVQTHSVGFTLQYCICDVGSDYLSPTLRIFFIYL
jgi:hypothetical protein